MKFNNLMKYRLINVKHQEKNNRNIYSYRKKGNQKTKMRGGDLNRFSFHYHHSSIGDRKTNRINKTEKNVIYNQNVNSIQV